MTGDKKEPRKPRRRKVEATNLQAWVARFLAEAEDDEYLRFLARREREGYCDTVEWAREAIRNTTGLVCLAAAGMKLELPNQRVEAFLRMQVYDLANGRTRYVLTFLAGVYPWARLLTNDLGRLDLAFLFDATGFSHLTIERLDGKALADRERRKLKEAVRRDFFYDAPDPDEDLILAFDSDPTALHVMPRTQPRERGAGGIGEGVKGRMRNSTVRPKGRKDRA